MLNTLSKLLISRSLDSGRPPPAWAARRIERSEDLRRFAGSAARLDRALAASPPPRDDPSPFLATRIRAAIESAPIARDAESVWSPRTLIGVAAAAIALAGVFVGVRLIQQPGPSGPVAGGASPADLLGRFRDASPWSLMASIEQPIQDEARQLWDETRRAGGIVLARLMPSPPSLPR